MKIFRFPDPAGDAGGGSTPSAPVYSTSNLPKSKEEWDGLAKTDKDTWISLTQARMDQTVRENRELKERHAQNETRFKNLETEFTNLKKTAAPAPVVDPSLPVPYSTANLPATKEAWDTLALEDPTLAIDLRTYKNDQDRRQRENQTKSQTEFQNELKKHRQKLQVDHPDMYVSEVDAEGKPKVDDRGKPVLKIDANTGEPIPNLETEKGKLWVQIFSEDPDGYLQSKRGPRLMQLELERRLKERGEQQIQAGQGKAAEADERGVMPGGVPPPVTAKVSFISDEEKSHAQKAVDRGIYKSLQEYCQFRDGKNTGMTEAGRVPTFG